MAQMRCRTDAMAPAKSFQARLQFRIECQEVGFHFTETLFLPPTSTYLVQQHPTFFRLSMQRDTIITLGRANRVSDGRAAARCALPPSWQRYSVTDVALRETNSLRAQ
jgi:hypothetical protein